MTLLWPRSVLTPQDPMFDLAPMTVSGPVAQGLSDIVAGDAGYWRVTFGNVVVTTRARVLTWNAIKAKLQGRLKPILVPYCSAYQPLLALVGKVPHDDESTFDDGSEYLSGSTEVYLSADVAKDATSCTVDIVTAGEIQPGHRFSLEERLYEINDISGNVISFLPTAREAVIAGTQLNFDNPVCRVRLATDREMAIQLEGNRRALVSVNFVEDLL